MGHKRTHHIVHCSGYLQLKISNAILKCRNGHTLT